MRTPFGTGVPSGIAAALTVPSSGANVIGTITADENYRKSTNSILKTVATAKAAASGGSVVSAGNTSKRKATATISSAGVTTKKTRPLNSSSLSNNAASFASSSTNNKYKLVTKPPTYKPRYPTSSSLIGRPIGGGLLNNKGFKNPKR